MPFSFKCQTCQKAFTVSRKLIGKKIRCKGCSGEMRIPEPDDFVEIQNEWVVDCDDCGRQHRPDESLMGKRVRCKCGAILHLAENPNAQIKLTPLESDYADPMALPPMAGDNLGTPLASVPQQAPLPSFQQRKPAETFRDQRRRDAESMVRAADEKESWRRQRLSDDDDDEEWGAIGTMVGGVAMFVGGGVWAWLAWQAGYIYPYSFILMAFGVIAFLGGIVKVFID